MINNEEDKDVSHEWTPERHAKIKHTRHLAADKSKVSMKTNMS
jgi:hypothetical protein